MDILKGWGEISKELKQLSRTDQIRSAGYDTEFDNILSNFSALTGAIQREIERVSKRTTIFQFAGLAMSILVFLFITFHLLGNLNNEDAAVVNARRENEEILETVSEGLFLVDEDLVIGSEFSRKLVEMFRRSDFEGMVFENLLRDIVPEKVLTTAMDYVRLLWTDRVNENLVKSLNPLDEVQVNFDDGSGHFETLYLEFDFTRVKKDGVLSHLLVTVVDITRRVELAQELERSQADSQAQLDLLLSILHVDPGVLAKFLNDTDSNLNRVNAALKEPARDQGAFKDKLNSIFVMIHSIKGDASAIGLSTIEERSHAFEDMLVELRDQPNLTGNDFLPLTVRLDDLMNHLVAVRSMVERLLDFQQAGQSPQSDSSSAEASAAVDHSDDLTLIVEPRQSVESGSQPESSEPSDTDITDLAQLLQSLIQRIAERQGKRVRLETSNLESLQLDDLDSKAMRDVAIQLVRNAVVHGLETPDSRLAAGKGETGLVQIKYSRIDNAQILQFYDDGAGLNLNQIKATALANGVIDENKIDQLTESECTKLIFQPGFSTSENVDEDAGRGVGMDLVRRQLNQINGRLKIKSVAGKGTLFSIMLPAHEPMGFVTNVQSEVTPT